MFTVDYIQIQWEITTNYWYLGVQELLWTNIFSSGERSGVSNLNWICSRSKDYFNHAPLYDLRIGHRSKYYHFRCEMFQKYKNGLMKLLVFWSRTLKQAECNYSNLKKECLNVIRTVFIFIAISSKYSTITSACAGWCILSTHQAASFDGFLGLVE